MVGNTKEAKKFEVIQKVLEAVQVIESNFDDEYMLKYSLLLQGIVKGMLEITFRGESNVCNGHTNPVINANSESSELEQILGDKDVQETIRMIREEMSKLDK